MKYLAYFLLVCYLLDSLGYGDSKWIPLVIALSLIIDLLFLLLKLGQLKAKA